MTILNETAEILRLYFIQQKKLSLSEIGSFDLIRDPAVYNASSGVFSAPRYFVHFSSNSSSTSKDVIVYLSKKKNISEPEAIAQLETFKKEVHAHLEAGEVLHWSEMGSLVNKNGQIEFTADPIDLPFLEPIQTDLREKPEVTASEEIIDVSETIINEEEEESKQKKNSFLIVLLLLSLLIIAFSVIQNKKFTTHRAGAVQPAEIPEQFQLKSAE